MTSLRRICLVGVRGVGKTTLIRSILPAIAHFDYIVGSAVLRELAGPDFARFDHLPVAAKLNYRRRAIEWMEDRQRSRMLHLLCDGHTSLLDESTGQVDQVFTDSDANFFRELILLEAPQEVVLARRLADRAKHRSHDPQVIRAELAAESATCRQMIQQHGLKLHHLPAATDPRLTQALLEVLAP